MVESDYAQRRITEWIVSLERTSSMSRCRQVERSSCRSSCGFNADGNVAIHLKANVARTRCDETCIGYHDTSFVSNRRYQSGTRFGLMPYRALWSELLNWVIALTWPYSERLYDKKLHIKAESLRNVPCDITLPD